MPEAREPGYRFTEQKDTESDTDNEEESVDLPGRDRDQRCAGSVAADDETEPHDEPADYPRNKKSWIHIDAVVVEKLQGRR